MPLPFIPPPAWTVLGLGAQRALVRHASTHATTGRRVLAGCVAAGAVAIFAETATRFRRRDTTILPEHPEHTTALSTDGANAFSRNPIYLAMALLLTANALRSGDRRALIPVAAFVALMTTTQIRAEEAALRSLFGPEYDDYCRRVRRWL